MIRVSGFTLVPFPHRQVTTIYSWFKCKMSERKVLKKKDESVNDFSQFGVMSEVTREKEKGRNTANAWVVFKDEDVVDKVWSLFRGQNYFKNCQKHLLNVLTLMKPIFFYFLKINCRIRTELDRHNGQIVLFNRHARLKKLKLYNVVYLCKEIRNRKVFNGF